MAQVTGAAIGGGGRVSGQDTDRLRTTAGSRPGGSRAAAETRRQDEVVLSRQARHAPSPSTPMPAQAAASLLRHATGDSAPTRSLDPRGAQDLSRKVSQAILARPDGATVAQANTSRDSAMAVLH